MSSVQPITATPDAKQGPRGLAASPNIGPLWVALAAVGMVWFFWPGLVWVLSAWERPEYSHGYLIPPIALYLFLAQLRQDTAPPPAAPGRALGIAVTLLGLLVGVLGNLIEAPGITIYGLVVCIAGVVLTAMGTRRGLRYWAPLFYLVFMLPLPTVIYWQLSIRLQMISSQLGVSFISLFGVPVILEGNVIDLGVYQLQVAEACSGLRYLFPLASFGFLFAVLYKGPLWHKVVLFLSTAPITVLMNAFRIGVIGLLVDRFGIEQAEGFLHFFEGWIIFVACIAILYAEAALLQRLAPNRQPIQRMLEIDVRALWSEFSRFRNVRTSAALAAVSVLILGTALVSYAAPARQFEPPRREPLVLFPMALGEWQGKPALLDPSVEAVLGADDYLDADYALAGEAAPVNLFVAYYGYLTQGAGIHSPEVCLPAGGWEVSAWQTFDSGLATPSGAPLVVNRAIIQHGTDRRVVYYWFQERERVLTNDYAAKAYTVWDSLTRGRADGALVRVITPVDGPIAAADARLREFLKRALPQLPGYVPQ